MEPKMHGRFLEQVKASGLTEAERIQWVAFAADLDDEDIRPLVELIDESPGALERMTKTSRLERQYLETKNPAILPEIRNSANAELAELLGGSGETPAHNKNESGVAMKE